MADETDLALSAGGEATEPDADLKDAEGSSGKVYTEEEIAEILAENRELQGYKDFEAFADLIKEMKAQGHKSGEDFKSAAWKASLDSQETNLEQMRVQADDAAAQEYRLAEKKEGWRDGDGSPEQSRAMAEYLGKINKSLTVYTQAKSKVAEQRAQVLQRTTQSGPVPESTINSLMKQYPLASRKTLTRVAQSSTEAEVTATAKELQESAEAAITRAQTKSAAAKSKPAPETGGAQTVPKKDGEFPHGSPPNPMKDPKGFSEWKLKRDDWLKKQQRKAA